MNILLLSNKNFIDKLPTIKFNLQKLKHNVVLPTFQLGKISQFSNSKKEFMDKDINKIKNECDCILVANFKKGRIENYIGPSLLMLMTTAYLLNKKVYILYDVPNSKNKEEINVLNPICLNGDLKNIK